MDERTTQLLLNSIALKWHLKNLERRAFGFACLSSFLLGVLIVENITLAYICREKAHNSAENAAYDRGNDSCPRRDPNQTALKDKGGKYSNFVIGEPLEESLHF